MSQQPRRHHYIPQSIIRQFAGNQGKVWVYDKRKMHNNLFQAKPKQVFVMRNKYSKYDYDRQQYQAQPEIDLATIENNAMQVFKCIIKNVRRGKRPVLSADLYERWMRFYLSLLRRNPRLPQQAQENTDKILTSANPQVQTEGLAMSFREYSKCFPKEQEMIYHDGLADIAAGGDAFWEQDTQRRLQETGCLFAYIPQSSDKQFVLGDSVTLVQPEPDTPHGGAFLPIAPDIAVVYAPLGGIDIYPLVEDLEHESNRINRATFQQSSQIVSHSKILLQSLSPKDS